MKRVDEIAECKKASKEELSAKISGLQEELMKLRFRHSTGQLQHTARLSTIRQSIARAKTLLREAR